MRILLASPGLGLGGAERVVVSLAHGLRARGHEVAISGAPGPLDAAVEGQVRRLVLPERGRSPIGVIEWTARLAAFIRAWRPHVVHAHNAKATLIAGAAARLARGPRRPPILATHHGAAQADRAGAARLMLGAADEVVLVSEGLREAFGDRPVIHNGIEAPPPAQGRRDGVLYVGRLEPVKNPQRFLDVAALVPEARFTVVGDGSLRGTLQSSHATFLGARDDARELMAQAELLLVTSDSEGMSIAVLEALAAGTPVVSTPVSGMRELDGVAIAGFQARELAEKVRELLQDPGRRTIMGEAGAKLVRQRFSADAMVESYVRAYTSLTPTIHD